MFITHFNRMIRNRILWGAFAFIVVISFIGAGSTRRGCRRTIEDDERGQAGKLFGRNVSTREFFQERYFEMGLREDRNLSPADEKRLRQRTWMRIAALDVAKKMGLTAAPAELTQAIAKDPAFQVNGAFSADQYRSVIQNRLRVDVETFEQFLRETLTMQKLMHSLSAMVWASPSEVAQRIESLTDVMTVQYAVVSNDVRVADADLSKEALETYFQEHKSRFTIPEKIRVKFVTFPVTNYLAAAEITDAEIRDYYDDHIEEYSTSDTNQVSVPKPLDAVKGEITSVLRQKDAKFKARDAATMFGVALTPDRTGRAPTFETVAQRMGVTVQTSGFFSAYEYMTNLAVGLDFNKAAFALDPRDVEASFSDAVSGEDASYLMAFSEKQASREPTFEEVRDRVVPELRRDLAEQRFAAKVKDVRATIIKDLPKTGFLAAAKAQGLPVVTNAPFSAYEGMSTNDVHAETLTPELVNLAVNKVSEPIATPSGAILACVTAREKGDAATAQLLRPQLLRTLDRYRTGVVYESWAKHLLKQSNLKVLIPEPSDSKVEEETDDAVPPPARPARRELPPLPDDGARQNLL